MKITVETTNPLKLENLTHNTIYAIFNSNEYYIYHKGIIEPLAKNPGGIPIRCQDKI